MSEQPAVQNPMLQYAAQIGWQRVGRRQALQWRGGDGGLFFIDILHRELLALNPGIVDDTAVLEWLRGEKSVFVPAKNRERNQQFSI